MASRKTVSSPTTDFTRRGLSIQASAQYLSATTSFIRHLIAIGELRFTKAGQRFVIDRLDLDGWLETHKQIVIPKLVKTEAA